MRRLLFNVSICFLLCCLLNVNVRAQEQEKPYVEPKGLNNWYAELGGAALFYSLNYEKILYRSTKLGWVGRVGLGYNNSSITLLNKVDIDSRTFMMPFTTAVLLGSRERKEKLEIGGGITLIATGINNREIVPTMVFGFRVLETNKVCFRITYTPFIRDGKYENWFGVSLGRNFGK